ncbi:SDR family oxidoreductase [Rhodohalobacter halophilus]|uniref:SDR family oxidoreductase n=1 Tax=Rhodohalobacter halophilus TaxID=1812810 RepID=UPI00083FB30B|nr:SDR family oxidoreductase [Rhodohalobacter halophilus]
MELLNKVAIVTGASSGIGTAFSKKLIDKGATVYGLARRLNKLEDIQSKLGEKFIPVQMDVTKHKDIEEWVNNQFDEDHLPDILVNNAGLARFGNVDDLTVDDWDTMVQTNLNGIFYLTRVIVPLMKQNPQHCHIINIASVAGLLGNPQLTGYNATKFGVRGFSEALFKELRYDKIKVSAMFPGSIATDFFNKVGSETHANMMQPGDVADTLIHLLETPDNLLINEVTMRPLNPKNPDSK